MLGLCLGTFSCQTVIIKCALKLRVVGPHDKGAFSLMSDWVRLIFSVKISFRLERYRMRSAKSDRYSLPEYLLIRHEIKAPYSSMYAAISRLPTAFWPSNAITSLTIGTLKLQLLIGWVWVEEQHTPQAPELDLLEPKCPKCWFSLHHPASPWSVSNLSRVFHITGFSKV